MMDAYPDMQDRFKKPEGFEFLKFQTSRGTTVRAGQIRHPQSKATIYVFQGQREFIEGWYEMIGDLYKRGFSVCICERDGEGGSSKNPRNPQLPSSLPYQDHLKDMEMFLKDVCPRSDDSPAILLTNSLGGLYGLHYLKKNPGYFDHAIFVAPPFGKEMKAKRDLMIMFSAAVSGLGLINKDSYIPGSSDWSMEKKSGGTPKTTHDLERYQNLLNWQIHCPEFRMGGPTYGNLSTILDAMRKVKSKEFVEDIATPCTILSVANDFMVSDKSHHEIAARMPNCKVVTFEGARHNLVMEQDQWRGKMLEVVRDIADAEHRRYSCNTHYRYKRAYAAGAPWRVSRKHLLRPA